MLFEECKYDVKEKKMSMYITYNISSDSLEINLMKKIPMKKILMKKKIKNFSYGKVNFQSI